MSSPIQQNITTWINEVFKSRNYDKITLQFPDTDTSGGYAAEMFYVNVKGQKDGTEENISIIVKKGRDTNAIEDTLNLRRAYTSEVRFYAKYIPYLRKFAIERNVSPFDNTPICYGTIDRENQYVIFMENLKVSNFKVHDIKKTIDLNHTRLVLKAYAKLHALCFALRDQEPKTFDEFKGECTLNLLGTKVLEYVVETIHKELESVIDIYREKKKQHIIDKLLILKQKYEGLLADTLLHKDEDYLVLRHADCWNNNYLFHYNEAETIPDKVVIIDWQFGIFGSPLADITAFLFNCCSRKELEDLDKLLKFYHEEVSIHLRELGSEPEQCFPWKICQESFKRYTPVALAGLPQTAKLSCRVQMHENFDIVQGAAETGNFCDLFDGKLRDPEEYFNRINGVFELCVEKGLF